MMPKQVRIEVWPVAADHHGVWKLGGLEAIRPPLPLDAADEAHGEVVLALATAGFRDPAVIHSTSWRDEGGIVLTYIAVMPVQGDHVLDEWPDAIPLEAPELLKSAGPPIRVAAAEAPIPRYLDVLIHAVRHLAFLWRSDAAAREAMPAAWAEHLERMTPALAGMYREAS